MKILNSLTPYAHQDMEADSTKFVEKLGDLLDLFIVCKKPQGDFPWFSHFFATAKILEDFLLKAWTYEQRDQHDQLVLLIRNELRDSDGFPIYYQNLEESLSNFSKSSEISKNNPWSDALTSLLWDGWNLEESSLPPPEFKLVNMMRGFSPKILQEEFFHICGLDYSVPFQPEENEFHGFLFESYDGSIAKQNIIKSDENSPEINNSASNSNAEPDIDDNLESKEAGLFDNPENEQSENTNPKIEPKNNFEKETTDLSTDPDGKLPDISPELEVAWKKFYSTRKQFSNSVTKRFHFLEPNFTTGSLQGIPLSRRRPVEQLLGINPILEEIRGNFHRFVHGHNSLHMLLWGYRGTGKSSSVVLCAQDFFADGLRIVDFPTNRLDQVPFWLDRLAGFKEKLVLFFDDLSFEKDDPSYKFLKSKIEGGLRVFPPNVLLCATTNKMELVTVNSMMDERTDTSRDADDKLALDDRFGLKIYFDSPTPPKLHEQLIQMAMEEGLEFDKEKLIRDFSRFCMFSRSSSPAGRTIRQFLKTIMPDAE